MKRVFFSVLCIVAAFSSFAQTDTLRLMAYNVLYYGSGCQGPTGLYHGYLETIVKYTNPDILSLEKMGAIKSSVEDKYGTSPVGFADSVVKYALDGAFPGRYAHCPYTNAAKTNNMAVLFYDRHKLGFLAIVSSYSNVTDFNTYKLYYKDPNLARTHDTTFLYVIPNHDMSGDDAEQVRGVQITEVMKHTKEHFARLPNMINMGDFNARNSDETFYQVLTNPDDTNFRFFDPPFLPDRKFSYPADWSHNKVFANYFTTSTRGTEGMPNACGTAGGGKNWYDHIFLSPSIVYNTDHIMYLPNSYRTIGNDGHRYKISINDNSTYVNTSAPKEVIEAEYLMSNKYPIMADLLVTFNTNGISPVNPEIAGGSVFATENITVENPVGAKLVLHFPADMTGQEITIECFDKRGVAEMSKTETISGTVMKVKCELTAGDHTIKITGHHNVIVEMKITKE